MSEHLLKALESSRARIALVIKGIDRGHMSDATIITHTDGPTAPLQPLSDILRNELKDIDAAIAKAEGNG